MKNCINSECNLQLDTKTANSLFKGSTLWFYTTTTNRVWSKYLNPQHLKCSLVVKTVELSHLHHHDVFGALPLNFGVLDFDRYCSPIMQYCLVDLGQGGCTSRLLLKGNK